jgi:hypothetical protein
VRTIHFVGVYFSCDLFNDVVRRSEYDIALNNQSEGM